MAGTIQLVWVKDFTDTIYNMEKMRRQVPEKARRIMQEFSEETESWMKENAPWGDRSGAARESLTAEITTSTEDVVIMKCGYDLGVLMALQDPSRQRDYSIYLEGYLNLSILQPTYDEKFPDIMGRLGRGGFVDF